MGWLTEKNKNCRMNFNSSTNAEGVIKRQKLGVGGKPVRPFSVIVTLVHTPGFCRLSIFYLIIL
jgi:hypothetical protein